MSAAMDQVTIRLHMEPDTSPIGLAARWIASQPDGLALPVAPTLMARFGLAVPDALLALVRGTAARPGGTTLESLEDLVLSELRASLTSRAARRRFDRDRQRMADELRAGLLAAVCRPDNEAAG